MLDDDGNVRTIESKSKNMVEEEELHYRILSSVNSANAYITSILAGSHENDSLCKHIICHHGAGLNARIVVKDIDYWVINGKISMSIGSTIGNNQPCPLFSTTLSKLEDRFTFQISPISANDQKGVSSSFLQKIQRISPEQANGAIERNSQRKRQSVGGMLSRRFSTNDGMLRHCRIKSNFFTDTTFVIKLAKSICGYTFCI